MTSQDNQQYLTIELFNSKMETFMAQIKLGNEQLRNELNSKIDSVQSALNSKIDSVKSDLHTEIRINSTKTEMLEHTFYWGFGIMTLVITFVAVFVPYFIREHNVKKQEEAKNQNALSEQKVQDMITKTVDEAVAKALRNLGAFGK